MRTGLEKRGIGAVSQNLTGLRELEGNNHPALPACAGLPFPIPDGNHQRRFGQSSASIESIIGVDLGDHRR